MSDPVTPFVFEDELVRVRRDENGHPWFVAKDVCRVLGIQNPSDSVRKTLEEDEWITLENIYGNPRGGIPHSVTFVSESGLYALIFRSRKPQARAFRRWVTSEVLPAIRRDGRYEADAARGEAVLDAVKLQAEALCQRLRPAQRVDVLNVALQVCKFEGCADERSVLARYVSLCGVIAGPEADSADSDDALVERFLNERCAADPAGRVPFADLYMAYAQWCRDLGLEPRTRSWFGRRLGRLLRRYRGATMVYGGTRLLN